MRSFYIWVAAAAAAVLGATEPPPPDVAAKLEPLMQSADRAFEAGDLAAAHAALEQALGVWPTEPVAHFKLGMLVQQSQQLPLALPHLEQAAEHLPPSHPLRPDALGALGRLELQLAKSEQRPARRAELLRSGIDHVEGALELRPQLAAADPSLPRLLEQSRHELGGSDALPPAPPFDASWAKGSGWARDPALEAALEAAGLDAEGGTVERRDASELTWGEFKATFRGEKEGTVGRPLLLTNATAGWAAHGAAWEKPELLRRYGGVSAAVRWAVGTRQFGLIEREESLGRYAQTISSADEEGDAEPGPRAGMLFGNLCDVKQLDGCTLGLGSGPEAEDGKAQWWMHAVLAQAGLTNPGVSLGPSGAGLPWHNHDAAWQAVVRGAKLFLLLPPLAPPPATDGPAIASLGAALGRFFLPPPMDFVTAANTTSSSWLAEGASDIEALWAQSGDEPAAGRRKLQWVVVRPGDALFVPCNWWHATLNIGETLALGGQQQGPPPEGGSCPRDLYAEATEVMGAVSRGVRQRQAEGGALSAAEAQEGLQALENACAALAWTFHCTHLQAELLALAGKLEEAVAVVQAMATRMRSAHAAGSLSSVQLSAALDSLAEKILTLPVEASVASTAAARALVDEALALEPVHNVQAAVLRAVLARGDATVGAAATDAIERAEKGAPHAFWYRVGGAHGGTSPAQLRQRLGLPPPRAPPAVKRGAKRRAKSKKKKRAARKGA